MGSETLMLPIGRFAEVFSGFAFKSEDFTDSGIPIIKIKNVNNREVDLTTSDYLPVEKVSPKHEKFFLQDRDVLIAMTGQGSVGRVGQVRLQEKQQVLLNQRVGKFVTDSTKLNLSYLFYVISTPQYAKILFDAGSGSGQPNLSPSIICSIEIPVPSIQIQHAIAHILGNLDDKIELNRRMSETLEVMARALFKSWFVDFEPVRIKAEGRDTGLPRNIADLFPDSFEDSELGEVPKGWNTATLGTVLKQRVDRCVPSEDTASRPYVPIDCISSKSLYLAEFKSGAEAQSSLTRFYKNDLLFGAMRPYFHKVCIAPFDGTTRTTAFVLTPKKQHDFCFATMLLHHPDTIDYATRHSTGSTIPYAVWTSSLEDMPIVMPPPPIREAFNSIIKPLLDRIPPVFFESRNLAELRDALLPKILSGELTIKDAERFVGGVA